MSIEAKLDRLITLLETKEEDQLSQMCLSNKNLLRDLFVHTILASTVGYFLFRILDHYLGGQAGKSKS